MSEDDNRGSEWRTMGIVAGFASEVAVLIGGAAYAGLKLDDRFDTAPVFVIGALLLAAVLIILLAWRMQRWFL